MEFIKKQGLTYESIKTPYFEIKVGDSQGEKMVSLPHHILRLVDKIEILETFEPGAFDTFTLSFVEGSREPASQDADLGTKGLYKIQSSDSDGADLDVAGSLTNRTGTIADLRFSGNGGVTFLTEREKRTQSIDTTLQKNVDKDLVRRSYPRENKRPTLLFQERNQIQITWGYKEDLQNVRTVQAYVVMVSVMYPENGHVTTTITCHNTDFALDQISPTEGVPFGKRLSTGQGSVVTFTDNTTEETVRKICDDAGLTCIVSKNLPVQSLDRKHQKVWLSGESFHEFMTRLAARENCIYKVKVDPKTGKDTLIFIRKQDFDKRIRLDRNLLSYKAPNSILKRAEIKVDFGAMQGALESGYDEKGENLKQNSKSAEEEDIMFINPEGKEVVAERDPVEGANPVAAAKNIVEKVAGGNSTSNIEVTPTESNLNKEKASKIKEKEQSKRTIQLDFTTIGYNKITPGTFDIGGLGVRYNGKYRVMTARHIITNSSYTTECLAVSMALAAGGQINPEAIIAPEEEATKTESEQQFANDDVMKKYDKVNQTG